jgi:hypothetical protein
LQLQLEGVRLHFRCMHLPSRCTLVIKCSCIDTVL